jgi:hypothetical protein
VQRKSIRVKIVSGYKIFDQIKYFNYAHCSEDFDIIIKLNTSIRVRNQTFWDWQPGERTANGTALCH